MSGNETDSDGGGIILDEDVDAIITRTSVVDNYASENIGGIDVMNTDATINNVTVSRNASGGGGGVGITNANVDITNSIVWENTGNEVWVYSGSATVTYSDIEGGYDGEGNIDVDPLFTDADNGDYTLQSGSPCIDAGTADTDGDGEDDITDYFGEMPDMGAFEFLTAVSGLQYFIQDTYVILAWNPMEDVQYYALERSTDPEFESDVMTQYITQNTYTDNDLEFNVMYYYRVAAFVGYWTSWSNVVSLMLESVGIAESDGLPTTYAVHQNHPNPFNPVTSLRYDLPEDGIVNITVFDMMGRRVSTLMNSHQNAGYKSIQWNATNTAGQPVSAGIYLYTIRAGEFMQTKKMILLK